HWIQKVNTMTTESKNAIAPEWDDVIPEADQAAMHAAGYGAIQEIGDKPAILVIDVNYGFTGDAPDDLMTAISKKRTACGKDAWRATEVISQILAVAREQNVPVIYA